MGGAANRVAHTTQDREEPMQESDELDDEPDFATREEQLAAEEAARIGGRSPDLGGAATDESVSDALRPVYEAGGGENDGWELAERDLVRNASHDDGEGFPEGDRFPPERESDRATIEYGEADDEEPRDL